MHTPTPPEAAVSEEVDLDALEADNARIVTAFCKAWEERNVELLLPYLADNVFYQMWDADDAIAVNGKEEFLQTVGPFLESVDKIEFDILRTQQMGKVVINERIDRFLRDDPEMGDWIFPITGVFILEDGKIIHWKDYRIPGKPTQM